ncbi:uncharacterized protein [Ptychodera flava]|uniref:uncharacterized protein n=1 Tax=Ptychodera flava TaxID=63121 RepID=UPI00396A3C19
MNNSKKSYRRVKSVPESDSDSGNEDTGQTESGHRTDTRGIKDRDKDEETPTSPTCYSRRLQNRADRKLIMPTRNEILESIVPPGTPSKPLDSLRPRKLVNNFIKVHNRYNYDPAYSDEENDEFIVYSNEESESDSDSSKDLETDSSHESVSESQSENPPTQSDSDSQESDVNSNRIQRKGKSFSKLKNGKQAHKRQRRIVSIVDSSSEDSNSDCDDDDDIKTTRRRNSSASALLSSEEEEEEEVAVRRSDRAGFMRDKRNAERTDKLANYRNERQKKKLKTA